MNLHLAYERSVNVLAGSVAMVAQRLPFLKNLSPFLGSIGSMKYAAPLAVNYLGIQALTGQTGVPATLEGVNGSPNPVSAAVGEDFVWSFQASSGTIRSFKVEILTGGNAIEGLPEGLSTFLPSGSRFGYIGGIPEEAGSYDLEITAYNEAGYQGFASVSYQLTLNISGTAIPYEEFIANFWSGEDLEDPAIVGPNADSDGDGIENVLEFVLDLDPTRREAMPGTFGSDPEGKSMLRYAIPLNEFAADATVVFEESTSGKPDDWAPVPAEQSVRTNTEIVLTTPRGPGKKLYRLKVTL